jgi:ABC-type branched-subunit amino acid transport system substrate-binding protein
VICDIKLTRKSLFLGLILAIVISDSFIYFAEIKTKAFYSSWIIGINASTAAALAIFVVYRHMRQRSDHPQDHHSKSHVALAIGLSLWLCADIIWAMYEIVLEIVPPVPSAADFVWLSAYGFLAYYLYATFIEFHKKFRFSSRILVASIIGCGIFLAYIIALTSSLSVLSTPRGIAMFAVIIAYPIMDAVLMVPAIVILSNFRKEPLWFTPWICESLGLFLMAISDSWFAVVVLMSILEEFWLSATFFAAHYLVIAAGLLWYVKFLLTQSQPSDDHRRSEQMETSIIAPRGDYTNEPKSEEEEKRKKISSMGLMAVAVIAVIAVSSGVYFSLYSLPSLSSYFPFSNPSSEVIAPAPATALRQQTVKIGALLPITGIGSSLGESEGAALKIATKDINEYLFKTNSSIGIELIIEDSGSDPSASLENLKKLAAKGIRIVIGPATSAAVQGIKDYADKNGIILISPSATAPSLAKAGDNFFRFVPDDSHQAPAISELMWNDGIRVIVPFWRTDIYGNDLVKATKQNFQALGGSVADGVGYTPNTGDFAASLNRINFIVWDQDLKVLDSKVKQAVSQYGKDKVGVYFVSYDEIAPIFIQAQNHPTLSKVKWYGSDKNTLNNKLIKNTEAAAFAVKTNFTTPIFGVENDNDERLKHIEAQIHEQIERTPRSYASVAYDTLWVAALAENYTNATHDINYLKNTIVKIADSYNGITGNTTLNQLGDRKYGDYDFWTVQDSESTHDSFIWKNIGKYVPNIRTQ